MEGTSRGTYPVRTVPKQTTLTIPPPRQPTSTETLKGPFPKRPHFWDITLLPVLAARPPLCITKTSNHARTPHVQTRNQTQTHVQT